MKSLSCSSRQASRSTTRGWIALAAGVAVGFGTLAAMASGLDDPPQTQPSQQPQQPAPAEQPQQPRGPRGPEGRPMAPEGQRPQQGQPGARGGGPVVSVEAAMKIMGRSLRTIKAQAGDAEKREENLRLVNDMQRGCVTAKGGAPESILKNAASEADKAKMKDEYRKGLVSLLKKLIELEEAIGDNKGDAAKGLVDEVVKMRDEMHEKMGVKDE